MTISESENNTINVKIKTDDPKILIGQNGQTLSETQHLLRTILRHNIPDNIYINLDVNNYKEKKTDYLKQTARSLAEEVALTRTERELMPMPAYERRIVHMELANREDVVTESTGDFTERRVKIKPKLA